MDFDTAMGTLGRAAGDILDDFMGEPRAGVSREAIHDATRSLLKHLRDSGADVPDPETASAEQLDELAREVIGEALEDDWHEQLSPALSRPEKRAEMIGFIEDYTGRPLPA